MVKKFTIPFASQGDANDIPDALQVDGKVSFTQGFGYDYERPYDDPQAKDIAREDMNGLFKAITSAVGELQTLGASEWSNAIAYPKGAIVYYEKDLYISQVDDNQNKPPQNWVSITSIANDSLKKAENLADLTDKAIARNNLGLGSSATLNKTDILGTSSNLVATQKLVNDTRTNINNDINNKIDKTSITDELGDSTELVASQALVDSVNNKQLAVNQKWVDVKEQRAVGVEYTNNSGSAIAVAAWFKGLGAPSVSIIVDGAFAGFGHSPAEETFTSFSLFTIIPAKSRYSVEVHSGTGIEIAKWVELR